MVAPANADIYMYVDKDGVMHFTNTPTSSRYEIYVKGRRSRPRHYSTTKYDDLITEASEKYGVPFSLVKAIIKVESNFNHRAVSKAGAMGLMQIMPFNLELLDIADPFDPWENIMGGTRFFKKLLKRFDGNLAFALAGYNAGPKRVDKYNGIPPIRETQNYVKLVKKYYRIYNSKS
ncbi:MAG: lytic transglycosylase domain-containing protein [Desulfobacteraceae bacterium]|nr:lytic transglycosylase domain-containing protein [Desulfobacteraceae bacterium]